VEKKKAREVVLSVAALVTRDLDPQQDMLLFIKRSSTGLLANQARPL
jgi:hypothetical protein